MILSYRITISQQLSVLYSFLIVDGGAFIAYIYFFGFSLPYAIFILPLSLLFILTVLPVIILHTQYFLLNRNSELLINREDKTITYISGNTELKAEFNDIESLQFYGSFAGDSGIYTFSAYRFYKIILKDKREIIVTSLMMKNIKNELPKLLSIGVQSHYSFLATIR
jgi:hypothetical protein